MSHLQSSFFKQKRKLLERTYVERISNGRYTENVAYFLFHSIFNNLKDCVAFTKNDVLLLSCYIRFVYFVVVSSIRASELQTKVFLSCNSQNKNIVGNSFVYTNNGMHCTSFKVINTNL